MAKIKEIIKILIPPIISILYRKIGSNQSLKWSGRYAKWDDALMQCTGYENDSILEKCKISLLKVKNGEKAYERDSVVFDQIDYCWEFYNYQWNIGRQNCKTKCKWIVGYYF